jgi:tetratricopeptide (TPR) repeat protein
MRLRWLILVLLAWAAAPSARAQQSSPAAPATSEDRTEEAKGLFNAGRASFDAGRYADALEYFQRSYAISGKPALLYNIGLAFDRLREDEKALQAYDQYLTQAPDAPNRSEVETRAAAIREALSRRQAAPAATAPTPEQTAHAAPSATAPAQPVATQPIPEAEERDSGEGGLLTKWWFWTAVGVAVAGGVTATVVALGGGDEDPKPIQPGSGVIVSTLRSGP